MTFFPRVKGPVPPYANVAIQANFFQPSQFFISAITFGPTTTITTTVNNNYVVGQEVRLIIPPSFGCVQLNESSGFVLSIPSPNQVVVSINSSFNVDPFIASTAATKAQILSIGDINSGYTSTNGINILNTNGNTNIAVPGSFINISPI
jgi:hypothetical protein